LRARASKDRVPRTVERVEDICNHFECSKEAAVIGALILGLVAGFIGKALMPGDDPGGFFATILLGLAGAALGWVIFTLGLGIGDDDMFDLGGLVGAVIGVIILLAAYRWWADRRGAPRGRPAGA
jgi:uncharacterized membrane protein YeaQ/YmgE (transglycosylase-associated protein family)